MKIPAIINFTDIHEKEFFGPDTKEYKALQSLNEEGTWKEYVNEQLAGGVSVRYDRSSDVFAIQPDKFQNNELKEAFDFDVNDEIVDDEDMEDDEDIDIEDIDDTFLDGIVNGFPEEDEEVLIDEPVIEQPVENIDTAIESLSAPSMQVVSLDDVMAIFQQMGFGSQIAAGTGTAQVEPAKQPLQGGEQALKNAFFQNDEDTLASDFPDTQSDIDQFNGKVNTDKMDVPVPRGTNTPQPGKAGLGDLSGNMLGGCIPPGNDYKYDVAAPGYTDGNLSITGPNNVTGRMPSENPSRLVADLPVSPDFDPEEDEELLLDMENEEEPQSINEDDDWDVEEIDGDFKHRDLDRIVGNIDYTDEDDDQEVFLDDDVVAPVYEEPVEDFRNVRKQKNIGGQMVKLILTGIMITDDELNYIGEEVKKSGNVLKQIKGSDNKLEIIVESEETNYHIHYVDQPKIKTNTPFRIGNHNFRSINEALDQINHKNFLEEAKIFESIVGDDIFSRSFSHIKESDIFEDFKEAKSNSGWNVKSVGYLNLKNGLNETYSKVTQTGNELNTLMENEEGVFFLIKGNLKERSKVGTKREIVDMKENKSYGIAKVIGLYENTDDGLGKIMYKIKRTSIPLMVWR